MKKSKFFKRNERIFFLYSCILMKYGFDSSINELEADNFSFSLEQQEFIINILRNIDMAIKDLSSNNKTSWSWERISPLEKAVLINGYFEIKDNIDQKPIVINESINFIQKYSNVESKKFVNAILDKISN